MITAATPPEHMSKAQLEAERQRILAVIAIRPHHRAIARLAEIDVERCERSARLEPTWGELAGLPDDVNLCGR